MKTPEILNGKTSRQLIKRFSSMKPVKRFFAATVIAVLEMCSLQGARAQSGTVYSINIVGCVPDLTISLLTAQLTTAQRQALHAQNFTQLPVSARAAYLQTVAYAVGFQVASNGNLPTSAMLAQHLKTVTSIYEAPAIPAAYAQSVGAYLSVVSAAMQQLNVPIAGQVVNSPGFQQAMYAGAVDAIWQDDWLAPV